MKEYFLDLSIRLSIPMRTDSDCSYSKGIQTDRIPIIQNIMLKCLTVLSGK